LEIFPAYIFKIKKAARDVLDQAAMFLLSKKSGLILLRIDEYFLTGHHANKKYT